MTKGQEITMHLVIGYLCLLLGGAIGLHRFYFGKWFWGIMYILTGGFCMIGVIVDIMFIPEWVNEKVFPESQENL